MNRNNNRFIKNKLDVIQKIKDIFFNETTLNMLFNVIIKIVIIIM